VGKVAKYKALPLTWETRNASGRGKRPGKKQGRGKKDDRRKKSYLRFHLISVPEVGTYQKSRKGASRKGGEEKVESSGRRIHGGRD